MAFYKLSNRDLRLLKEIGQIPAVSGNEFPLDNEILAFSKLYPGDIKIDQIGNIIIKMNSDHWDTGKPTILVSAHKDKIGFMVDDFLDNGIIRLAPVGGIIHAKSQQPLLLYRGNNVKLTGALEIEINGTYVSRSAVSYCGNFGFLDKTVAQKNVSIGDPISITGDFTVKEDQIISPYLDDSIGVFIGLKLAQLFSNMIPPKINLAFAFTTQEEVGLRGIKAVLRSLTPSLLIVTDVVDTSETAIKGQGPVLIMRDPGIVVPIELRQKLVDLAKANNMPLQVEVYPRGGTSDWEISVTEGYSTIPLGLPTEFIHSPQEQVSKQDLENLLNFVALLIEWSENLIKR